MEPYESDESCDERVAIRDELKALSFEELLKLKEEVGVKYYNSTVLKKKNADDNDYSSESKSKKNTTFKRINKNRPREESSKVPVKSVFKVAIKSSPRDPRFDSLCGDFNESAFMKNFDFVDDIRKKEISQLQTMLKRAKNPENENKIRLAIDRLKNQQRARQMKLAKFKEKKSVRESNLQLIKEGKKPHFKRKGDKKALGLIDKYEKLKSEGKLEKYVIKKNKEISRKTGFMPPI